MCIIIDNNVAHSVFISGNKQYRNIHNNIFDLKKTKIKVVCGGKLRREYETNRKILRMILQLDKAGKAKIYKDSLIDGIELQIINNEKYISNDPHILALAKASNARILCTSDVDLQSDFTNKYLIDKPRGKVYKNKSHDHLFTKLCR